MLKQMLIDFNTQSTEDKKNWEDYSKWSAEEDTMEAFFLSSSFCPLSQWVKWSSASVQSRHRTAVLSIWLRKIIVDTDENELPSGPSRRPHSSIG